MGAVILAEQSGVDRDTAMRTAAETANRNREAADPTTKLEVVGNYVLDAITAGMDGLQTRSQQLGAYVISIARKLAA